MEGLKKVRQQRGHSPAPSPEPPAKAVLSSASVWEAGSGALCPPPQGVYPKSRWRGVSHGVSQMGLTVRTKGREELGRANREEARERAKPPLTHRARVERVFYKWSCNQLLCGDLVLYTGPSPKRLAGHSSQGSSHRRRPAEPDPLIIPMLPFLLASLPVSSSQCHSQEWPGSCEQEKWGVDLVASM